MRTLLLCGFVLLATITWAQQGVLVVAQAEDGTRVSRFIQVNYLNLSALCAALGGTTVNLYGSRGMMAPSAPVTNSVPNFLPQPLPTGAPAPSAPGAPHGRLDRSGPLAPLVPSPITDVVGVTRR